MRGDFEEPTRRENQWVQKPGAGEVTRRKDQPGDADVYGRDGRKTKNEIMAEEAAAEAKEYRGKPIREVIQEARPVAGMRPIPVGTGGHAEHVETSPQTQAGVPVVEAAAEVSAKLDA